MPMFSKIATDELPGRYADRTERIIARISFEQRSMVLPRALQSARDLSGVAFASGERSALAEGHIVEIKNLYPRMRIVDLDTGNPIKCADAIYAAVRTAAKADGLRSTLIDVSSFRREELLILVAALRSLDLPSDTSGELIYVSAAKMAEDWLSRNVVAHRSIIGYPGEIWPSRRTKLVLMIGFEVERARSIIENYEPAEVILGMAGLSESINSELHTRNKSFFDDLTRQFEGIRHTFEFSARDPSATARDLESAIALDDQYNIILAPLHTKLSTVGAGLFALKHQRVQICYAQVSEYNELTYSTPGPDTYVIPVQELAGDVSDRTSQKRRLKRQVSGVP